MKRFISALFSGGIVMFIGCTATMSINTEHDAQQLEEAKQLFKNQFEKDMHPIVQAYLDETLHDPDSFRLERYDYTVANYPTIVPSKERNLLPGKSPKTRYKQVLIPAYLVNVHFRSEDPFGTSHHDKMRFYLLKDKQLILPNNVAVSLIE